ncbi:MAG: hypothetical protein ACHQJ6_09380, partial [Candidatus Berkiellales bacterium]
MTNEKYIIFTQNAGVKFQPIETINAFKRLGVSKNKLIFRFFELKDIIQRYCLGAFSTDTFRRKIKKLFPEESKDWTDKQFDDAWNRMFEFDKKSHVFFEQIAKLSKLGLHIYYVT